MRQAEKVFQAQGDAHEAVAFHFGDGDEGVGFAQGGRELVFGEHEAAAGDFVAVEGGVAGFGVGDVEFFEYRAHVEVWAGTLSRGGHAGVEYEDVGVGAFSGMSPYTHQA